MLRLPRATPADSAPLRPVIVPGSKSASNRALLLAASARGPSRLAGVLDADDTRAMAEALRGCGAALDLGHGPLGLTRGPLEGARCGSKGYATCVLPAPRPLRVPDGDQLDVGASGTTLRFLLPWLAFHATGPVRIVGAPRLFERPLGPLVEVLLDLGAQWLPSSSGSRHTAGGVLHPISFPPERLDLTIDGAVSSQFASGLLLAAAVLPEASMLRVTNPTSASYLELTVRWLTRFGRDVAVETTSGPTPTWTARMAPGTLFGLDTCVPGDWSAAAAPLAAAAVTGRRVHVGPLDPDDGQGDAAILDILEAAGARVTRPSPGSPDAVSVEGPLQRGFVADLSTCPDLGPVLAAAAAVAPGPSVLTGLHTLPAKECDRLDASAVLVRWLGGEAEIVDGHTLRITPRPAQAPVEARPPFSPRNDHRMAFAAAVGALVAGGDLLDPGCVSKTWPGFWEAWEGMLGEVSPRTPRP